MGHVFFKFKCKINLTIELYIIMSYGIGNLKIIRTVAPLTLPLISFKGRERRINLVAEDDLHSELPVFHFLSSCKGLIVPKSS